MGERLNLEAEPPSVELCRVGPRVSPVNHLTSGIIKGTPGGGLDEQENSFWYSLEQNAISFQPLVLFTRDKRLLAVRQTKNSQ